jgi:pantoate--beta-alanine ligase
MITITTAAALKEVLLQNRLQKKSIGFVPTMGALHQGHLWLIKEAMANNHLVICSIFVNPTQFNQVADFEKYPVTTAADKALLTQAGTHLLFLPAVEEIYPNGLLHLKQYPLGYLATVLEGAYRPGHFQGVCNVMDKLLTLIQPNNLYMGQKDYQQCMVVKKLIEILQVHTTLHTCPTLREADGLAMSSRNMRLNTNERKQAVEIATTLKNIKQHIKPGNLNTLINHHVQHLTGKGFKVDYIALANAATLELVNEWDGNTKLVALAAAYLNEVRLIDNMLIN